jgi:hypothetical protein
LYKRTQLLHKQISLRPLQKIDKRKFKKISVELYEPFTLESWGILSQLGFICIVSIFLTIFKMNIKRSKIIKAFPGLKIPIRNSKYRFNDIVGSIFYQSLQRSFYILTHVIYFLEFLLFNQNQTGQI